MSRIRFSFNILATTLFLLALSTIANAQATRTWVSGVGDDVNPCSRTAPCKTWAGAISKTAAGGEIDALDPGGFGTLTITKSITIEGTQGQGFGSTLAAGTSGFIVNDALAASPNTSVVMLRNLSINGAGTGTNGIRYLSGASLTVDNCIIYSFNAGNAHGIDVNKTASGKLFVRDTLIRNCRNAATSTGSGISIITSGGTVSANIDNVRVSECQNGIFAQNGSRVQIRNSSFTQNVGVGIAAQSGIVNVESSMSDGNAKGVESFAGGFVRLSNCHITQNTTAGVTITGGVVETYQNNKLVGNTTPVSGGVLTTIGPS